MNRQDAMSAKNRQGKITAEDAEDAKNEDG
jgi:hypothetical protein